MKNRIKDLIFILLISSLIGVLVASPFNFILNQEWFNYLYSSALIGFCIGLVAYPAFIIFSLQINHHPFLAFFVVFLIIAIGTSLAVYYLATKSIILIICYTVFAELAGLTITFISWRHSIKLNNQLKEKKARLINQ